MRDSDAILTSFHHEHLFYVHLFGCFQLMRSLLKIEGILVHFLAFLGVSHELLLTETKLEDH